MASPMMVPPDISQQQGDQGPQSMVSRLGQMQSSSQAAGMQAYKALYDETSKIADATAKIAEMAQKILPSLMGDISKLIEVGKSMQQAIKQAMQQAQQGSSAAPEQAPAASPTDAAPPIAA